MSEVCAEQQVRNTEQKLCLSLSSKGGALLSSVRSAPNEWTSLIKLTPLKKLVERHSVSHGIVTSSVLSV